MELYRKPTETLSPILLSPREAAKLLSISECGLWRLSHKEGLIPFVKVGRLVRYLREDLEAFARQHARRAEPRPGQTQGEKDSQNVVDFIASDK